MTALIHVPAVASLLLLAAHALRQGHAGTACVLALAPLLLAIRQAWVRPALQLALGAGVFVWAETLADMIAVRQTLAQPWLRPGIIIGAAMAACTLGAALLQSRRAKDIFRDARPTGPPLAAFLLTLGLLLPVRAMVSPPMLILDRFFPGWGVLETAVLSVYAAMLTRAMLDPARSARLRVRVWGLFSLIFFAQLALGLAGADIFLMTGKLHLPVPALVAAGPLYRGQDFFMLGLFASTIVLVGPAWCSHLCYIGAWDAWACKAKSVPTALPDWRTPLRLGLTALVLGAALALRLAGAPMSLAVILDAALGLCGVAVMLVFSRIYGTMVHCTAFCPLGTLAALAGRLHPLGMRMDPETCTACGLCSRACRYGALEPEDIKNLRPGSSCTLCGDCVGACPHQAMRYRAPGLSPDAARALFLVLAVSLHAAFMGLARI